MIEGNGGFIRVEFKDRNNDLADPDAGAEVTIRVYTPGWRLLASLTLGENEVEKVAIGTFEAAYTAPSGYESIRIVGETVIAGAPQVSEPLTEVITYSGRAAVEV